MQAGAQLATMPQIAPVADAIMTGAGYQLPNPAGADPDFPVPAAPVAPVAAAPLQPAAQVTPNTSPQLPPVPRSAMQGVETARTTDNLPA